MWIQICMNFLHAIHDLWLFDFMHIDFHFIICDNVSVCLTFFSLSLCMLYACGKFHCTFFFSPQCRCRPSFFLLLFLFCYQQPNKAAEKKEKKFSHLFCACNVNWNEMNSSIVMSRIPSNGIHKWFVYGVYVCEREIEI